ncbi:MAG: hypothetical protein P8L68_09755 [Paracoccaceae bacterium]|nr:hypothetical protein [Paracoccaceae bacterium]MDG2258763.1 hypothetical protein [Paracoccaceae bacterium]
MTFSRITLTAALSGALGVAALTASAEELSVATFLPPQHHTNT